MVYEYQIIIYCESGNHRWTVDSFDATYVFIWENQAWKYIQNQAALDKHVFYLATNALNPTHFIITWWLINSNK